jgi:hypothetical protein
MVDSSKAPFSGKSTVGNRHWPAAASSDLIPEQRNAHSPS